MGTLTINRMTIAEVMKRLDPDGNLAEIAEVLQEENDILQDAPWMPSNAVWANKTTRRASEPAGTWRKFNQGVAKSRSETVEVLDTIGLLEDRSEIDVEIINSFPDKEKARSDEDKSFVTGLSKEMAATMIYGDGVDDPEEFTGLAPRLDALNSSLYNVVGTGGTASDLTSIYVVNWGRDCYMGYPPGTQAGLEMINMGIESVLDASSNPFLAYVTVFKWRAGLIVRDHKCIGRVCNIEDAGASNTFNEDTLIDLLPRMRTGPGTRMYVNKTVISQMWKRLKDKTNVYLTPGEGLDAGGPVMRFNGIPVRQVDQILITESAVV
jgi:hypothetical protein